MPITLLSFNRNSCAGSVELLKTKKEKNVLTKYFPIKHRTVPNFADEIKLTNIFYIIYSNNCCCFLIVHASVVTIVAAQMWMSKHQIQ